MGPRIHFHNLLFFVIVFMCEAAITAETARSHMPYQVPITAGWTAVFVKFIFKGLLKPIENWDLT